jgi:N-acetylglucosamine-6-sulfatase
VSRSRSKAKLSRLLAGASTLALAVLGTVLVATPAAPGATAPRPNVIVIMTDDQRQSDVSVMSSTLRDLGRGGATFRSSFVSFPLCCPSRATVLTGQYAHNHGVLSNNPPQGGYPALEHSKTLAVWLQRAGYYTAHIGKYLNGYGNPPGSQPTDRPPGWSEWASTIDPSTNQMYGFTVNENGTLVNYGADNHDESNPENYETDVFARKAVDLIRRRAGASGPFFLHLMPVAPHLERAIEDGPNPRPAPRHAGRFANAPLPSSPAFNEADVSDKPSTIKKLPPLTPNQIESIKRSNRNRLASLLAVDDLVGSVVAALRDTGQLDNTLVVFTSDNGYMLGEHRIEEGKFVFYEESARVPLLMRGPGIRPGTRIDTPVVNADLAPTILQLAKARPDRVIDGRSLLPLLRRPTSAWGRPILFETKTESGVRTDRYMYAEETNEQFELYDLRKDPYELRNRADDPAFRAIRRDLARDLRLLRKCKGTGCRLRPRIALRLAPTGSSACGRRSILAAAGSRDGSRLVAAAFTLGGRTARPRRAPFRVTFSGRPANSRRPVSFRARLTFRDGRVLSVDERLTPCAS